MDCLYLKLISIEDEKRVLDCIRELVANGSNTDGIWYDDSESFEEMIRKLKKCEHDNFDFEAETPIHYQYLLIRKHDEKLVGMFSIRPFLTQRLISDGGLNIGYSIRPTERKKGYATAGLALAIKECKKLNPNIQEALLGCSKDNIGSRKAITNNGGKLVEEYPAIITKQKYSIKM